jgi:hypothetical protein
MFNEDVAHNGLTLGVINNEIIVMFEIGSFFK